MQVRAWLARPGLVRSSPVSDESAVRRRTSTGRGWSTCRSPGLILGLRPFLGGATAERWAVAIAPLLPYLLLLLLASRSTVRRLIAPPAYRSPSSLLFCAHSTNGMFTPERIDHHGWQLALLALSVVGDRRSERARGGLVLGVSTALSLAIGLEMMPYLALAGVAMVLFWVERRRRARGGSRLMPSRSPARRRFASSSSRRTTMARRLRRAVAGLAVRCAGRQRADARLCLRVDAAAGSAAGACRRRAGIVIAGFHALTWPQCLSRPEGVSPELERLWLSHVKEARPFYTARLAHRDADHDPSRHRPRSAGAC